jgi:hypothetical protein
MPQNWHQQNLRERILEATATVILEATATLILEATAVVILKDELRVDVCPTINVAHIVTHTKSK